MLLIQSTCPGTGLIMPKSRVKPWSQDWLIAAGAYPGFCSMKQLEVFLLPLGGMLVRHRSLPRNLLGFPQQFAGTHLCTWVERGTVRVKCLAQGHNTMSLARTRTRTACSRVERAKHEATTPPTIMPIFFQFSTYIFSADITPEMLKLGRFTKVKVFFLVLVYISDFSQF